MLKVLRPGVHHPHVVMWEEFLQGYALHDIEIDNHFDSASVGFTKLFQEKHGLKVDGWVGGKTWGKAIELGLDILEDDVTSKEGLNWPTQPDLQPIVGTHGRMAAWGEMTFRPAGTKGNLEGVEILNDWSSRNIITVNTPQLSRVPGMHYKGKLVGRGPQKVAVHMLVEKSFLELWRAWDEAGLLDRIITWAGMWNTRFIRGSRTSLSNHAFATAFDINAPWNGLRRVPALVGNKGCVRELAPIANELGWFWGGHFTRKDGMHFEATMKALR